MLTSSPDKPIDKRVKPYCYHLRFNEREACKSVRAHTL